MAVMLEWGSIVQCACGVKKHNRLSDPGPQASSSALYPFIRSEYSAFYSSKHCKLESLSLSLYCVWARGVR